ATHGPHHGTQKSTSTGCSLLRTWASKLVSVTATVCSLMNNSFKTTENLVSHRSRSIISQLDLSCQKIYENIFLTKCARSANNPADTFCEAPLWEQSLCCTGLFHRNGP